MKELLRKLKVKNHIFLFKVTCALVIGIITIYVVIKVTSSMSFNNKVYEILCFGTVFCIINFEIITYNVKFNKKKNNYDLIDLYKKNREKYN